MIWPSLHLSAQPSSLSRLTAEKSERILGFVFRGWSAMTNYEHSQGGRIWLVWRDSVCMTPVQKTDQLITVSVGLQDEEEFFCTIFICKQPGRRKKRVVGRYLSSP